MKLWEFIDTLSLGDEWVCIDSNRRIIMTERGLRYADGERFLIDADALTAEYVQAQITEVALHQALRALDNGRRAYVSHNGGPITELAYNQNGDLYTCGDFARITRSDTYYIRGEIDPPKES